MSSADDGDESTRRQQDRGERPSPSFVRSGEHGRRWFLSRDRSQLADDEIVARLRQTDFDDSSTLWRVLARGLAEYAYPILVVWGVTGQLAAKVAEAGARGTQRAPRGRLDPDDAHEVATEILIVAIEAFRIKSLPIWEPEGGASLRTFFIKRCLFEVPDVHERWARRQRNAMSAGLVSMDDGRHSPRPDEEAEARVLTDQLLEGDPILRRMLELEIAGYDLKEIAQKLAVSPSAVKSRKFRFRRRIAEEALDAQS